MQSTSCERYAPGLLQVFERPMHRFRARGKSCFCKLLGTVALAVILVTPNSARAIDTPAGTASDTRPPSLPVEPIPASAEPRHTSHAKASRRASKAQSEPAHPGEHQGDALAEPDASERPPLRLRQPDVAQQAATTHWPRTPGQLGLTVGIPFFDDDLLHGDVTVDIRYGRKFWWFVPYVSGGFRATRMDPARVPPVARRDKLYAWHATLGLRFEIPANKHLFPFIGLAGEVAYWAFTEGSTEYCHEAFYPDAWRCYQPNEYKRGTALKPQIGLLYKPEASLALEFWVEYGVVQASEMFTRRVSFIHPAVGVAWHH